MHKSLIAKWPLDLFYPVALFLLAVLLTGCGDNRSDNAGWNNASGGSFPITVSAANGEVVVATRPETVVSLSPTATEMLFAIEAGPQVVAVDDQSTYPADAPMTALSGFTPNAEAIAGYNPDLVVISDDMNGLVAALGRLDIPVLLEPAAKNLDDVYGQIRDLGKATGNVARAEALAKSMEEQINGYFDAVDAEGNDLTMYHEVDTSLYSTTSRSFFGQLYARFGYENVADAADKDGTGYPQLSPEYLVQADPDVIFLADSKCCGQSLETVAARPGFGGITAVRTGNVVPLDDEIASRWGPRVVDLVKAIADATAKAKAEPVSDAA